jgi:TatD DNase family protein
MPAFDADRDAVLDRARESGVTRIMIPGIDLASSRRAVALAEAHPEIYAAVGVHPHDAETLGPTELNDLRALASHPKVRAIGEIGLDYYRDRSPREAQRRAFAQQLDLAGELGLPVIVHNRDAFADVAAALAGWPGPRRGVLHSFSGDRAQLSEALAAGFYIGITGPITFPKAHELRAVAAATPAARLLIETDAPYLTPAPRRGQRNEPAYVRRVAETLAEVRGENFAEVAAQTSANAAALFDWSS